METTVKPQYSKVNEVNENHDRREFDEKLTCDDLCTKIDEPIHGTIHGTIPLDKWNAMPFP